MGLTRAGSVRMRKQFMGLPKSAPEIQMIQKDTAHQNKERIKKNEAQK